MSGQDDFHQHTIGVSFRVPNDEQFDMGPLLSQIEQRHPGSRVTTVQIMDHPTGLISPSYSRLCFYGPDGKHLEPVDHQPAHYFYDEINDGLACLNVIGGDSDHGKLTWAEHKIPSLTIPDPFEAFGGSDQARHIEYKEVRSGKPKTYSIGPSTTRDGHTSFVYSVIDDMDRDQRDLFGIIPVLKVNRRKEEITEYRIGGDHSKFDRYFNAKYEEVQRNVQNKPVIVHLNATDHRGGKVTVHLKVKLTKQGEEQVDSSSESESEAESEGGETTAVSESYLDSATDAETD